MKPSFTMRQACIDLTWLVEIGIPQGWVTPPTFKTLSLRWGGWSMKDHRDLIAMHPLCYGRYRILQREAPTDRGGCFTKVLL